MERGMSQMEREFARHGDTAAGIPHSPMEKGSSDSGRDARNGLTRSPGKEPAELLRGIGVLTGRVTSFKTAAANDLLEA